MSDWLSAVERSMRVHFAWPGDISMQQGCSFEQRKSEYKATAFSNSLPIQGYAALKTLMRSNTQRSFFLTYPQSMAFIPLYTNCNLV